MILHYLDARLVGGIETHVEAIVRAQRDAGKDARILLHTAYTDSPAQARFAASGLPVVIAGGFAGLQRLIGKARPDLLHTHGYKAGIFGRLAARLAHVPVVSTFHAGERGSGMVGLYQRLDEATSGLGLRLAVSRDIAATLPQPVTLIRNFITPAEAPRLLPSTDNFLFAGRLSHEKGPDLFQDLARLRPDAGEWHMIGDGPMRADLENAAPSPVIMDGFQPSIGAFLDKASALVLTSRREGLPMAALEAMARGVPVIAPVTGALPDLIRDNVNGFLYQTGNMTEAASCIDRLTAMTPEGRFAMGEAAIRTIRNGFSPDMVLPVLDRAYAEAGLAA